MDKIALRAPKIALLSGSTREGSFNTKLIHAAKAALERIAGPSCGVDATILDLSNHRLPVYAQDLEVDGAIPPEAAKVKKVFQENDAFIVASPEYNGWPSSLLVNTYTWCSRGDPSDGPMYASFAGKSAIVMSSSPGGLGGLRSLDPHRQLLTNLGVNVLPVSVAIGAAFRAYENDGSLSDPKQQSQLDRAIEAIFFQARADANKEATSKLVRQHLVSEGIVPGTYGAINLPDP